MNERHEILRSGSFVDAAISVASFIVELAGRSVYSIGESSDRVRPESDVGALVSSADHGCRDPIDDPTFRFI
jgi:hypothetical protein